MIDISNSCYPQQFVQNETVEESGDSQGRCIIYRPLAHTPVYPGTVVGSIYHSKVAVQTFVIHSDGGFRFETLRRSRTQAVGGTLDCASGTLSLTWNEVPGMTNLVVSYEYTPEVILPTAEPVALAECRKPFDRFFDHEQIDRFLHVAGFVAAWDFNLAEGDTIREKYDSLLMKVVGVTGQLMKAGAKGYFWIVCAPSVGTILETVSYDFQPSIPRYSTEFPEGCGLLDGQVPMGLDRVLYVGLLKNRWRLYIDPLLNENELLIGVNDTPEEPEHYARLDVCNVIM